MAQHELKLGNLVRLASGGPVMTFGGDRCFWFMGHELRSGAFPPEALRLVAE